MIKIEESKNISGEVKKEPPEMTAYGQSCFNNGYDIGVEYGRKSERKQLIINFLKNGFNKINN